MTDFITFNLHHTVAERFLLLVDGEDKDLTDEMHEWIVAMVRRKVEARAENQEDES